MNWLITYTRNEITANCPARDIHPADWLLAMNKRYPENKTVLIYSIEISEKQFIELCEEI